MTLTTSRIDSPNVSLGELSTYGVSAYAMPLDIGSSTASVTNFNTTHAVEDNNAEYAIGQQLTLSDPEFGTYKGTVVSATKQRDSGRLTLQANTIMSKLAVTKRCYPIYTQSNLGTYSVAAAVDHFTQQCGVFFDAVPGVPVTCHSFNGHLYGWARDATVQPRWTWTDPSGNPQLVPYTVVGTGRIGVSLTPNINMTLTNAKVDLNNPQSALAFRTPVPNALENKQLALSLGAVAQGDLQMASTWTFYKEGISTPWADVIINASIGHGFSVRLSQYSNQSTLLLFPSLSNLNGNILTSGNRVRVHLGVAEHDATTSTFNLTVVDETTGAVLDSRTTTVACGLRGKDLKVGKETITAAYGVLPGGGTSTDRTPWILYSSYATVLAGALPAAPLAANKELHETATAIPFVPGFDGNVWDKLKELLALHRMDFWYEDDILKMDVRQSVPRVSQTPVTLSQNKVTATQRTEAQFVQVTNQNSSVSLPSPSVPQVFHKATTVDQVATGETKITTVQTKHSIDTVNQPTCVNGISPYPYTGGGGQYVVTGADGYIVSPDFWNQNGGKITAETTDKDGEIRITIKAPDIESVRSPYRISEGDNRPALYITGQGIANNPVVLKVPTGNPRAAQEIGESVDSPFVTDARLAYNAAAQMSVKYATPGMVLSFREHRVEGEPGMLARRGAGSLFRYNGNIYRISGTSQSATRHTEVQSSDLYNLISQINLSFNGANIAQLNGYYAGKTIKDINVKPLKQVTDGAPGLFPSDTLYPSDNLFPGGM